VLQLILELTGIPIDVRVDNCTAEARYWCTMNTGILFQERGEHGGACTRESGDEMEGLHWG